MVQDRFQRAAVVEADRRGQAPFVLVGPIDGHHVLTSSAEGLLAGPASQVGDGEPGPGRSSAHRHADPRGSWSKTAR
jgi:hypothetical protein